MEFRLLQNRFYIRRPVHGLIFLFKYVQDDEPAGTVVRDSRLEKIFFAKQVIMPTENNLKRSRNMAKYRSISITISSFVCTCPCACVCVCR